MAGVSKMQASGDFAGRVHAIGWALFFIWTGTAMLAGIRWDWALLGIGAIILGVQATLLVHHERSDGFMLALGAAAVIGGIGERFDWTWSIVPTMLIILGVAMLGGAFFGRRPLPAKTPPKGTT